MSLTSVLPSPAFSSRADVPAPFTGVFSHRGVLAGVAWQGGRGEADRCCRHKPLGLTKVDNVQATQTLFTSYNIFTPRRRPLLSPVGIFPVPLKATPQVSQAALGSKVWPCSQVHLFPPVRSWSCSIRNRQKEGKGSPRTGGFTLALCGHCLPTNLLLCGWGARAAATQLTVGRDWIQFLINRPVAPIQDSLVFVMLFS